MRSESRSGNGGKLTVHPGAISARECFQSRVTKNNHVWWHIIKFGLNTCMAVVSKMVNARWLEEF
jgi:hypothetical protein